MVETSAVGGYSGGNNMFSVPQTDPAAQKAEFLELLITQLRHQDPMEPQDSQEFAAQLAQFTSLEQLQNISSTLQQGVEADLVLTQTINNTMAASMIGKEVHAAGNTIHLDQGQEVDLHYQLGDFADHVTVSILDAAGNTVRTLTADAVGSGNQVLTWDGSRATGEDALSGDYTFTVEAADNKGEAILATPIFIGTIEGVKYGDAGAIFMVDGREIPFSDVLELMMPDQTYPGSDPDSDLLQRMAGFLEGGF